MSTSIPIKINATGELTLERCRCSAGMSEPFTAKAATVQPAAAAAERDRSSYGQILKSSALVGGSQVANIAISIVRTKAMAMLLGPEGFGLFGLFGSIQNLTQNIAGMGINSSGVRQIAEAVGTGDRERIAKTAAVLSRTAILLGLLGAMFLVLFSRQISRLTFGSAERAGAVSLLSVAVLFALISSGQGALIQGMRRIADLAKMNVISAFFGLCAAIPLVYFFRQQGVVPSLVVVAGTGVLMSWWYSRKIAVEIPRVTFSEVRQESSALLKLGSAFMASAMMTMGVAYAVRVLILHRLGLQATGLYQSAWTLGGLYVSFILQAMGADFYPRLTASIHNHDEANRLVNEQTLVGLLVAGPGVLATLTFAPLVIALFYSANFAAAVGILRWICLGATLQVVTWPMGFIAVAKGRQGVFFLSEFAWTVFAVAAALFCLTRWALEGAGIAFFCSYIFHAVLTYPIAHYLTDFRWQRTSLRTCSTLFMAIGLVFASFYILPIFWAAGIGIITTAAVSIYSLRVLVTLVSLDQLPAPFRRTIAFCFAKS